MMHDFAEQLIRDLQLDQHGLEILPSGPLIFAPQPDGSLLTLWRDPAQTLGEIERFSRADAARYPDFNALMCGSSTHPGGGITGGPGRLAALEILKEWK